MIRIMIVEDESATARGLALLITEYYEDFEVLEICPNGREGLKKALELNPDLIFVDINMPVMSGLEMIEEIRAAGLQPRCIILTGYADFEYARSAIHLGVSDYLLKPISPDTLDEVMVSCREQHFTGLRLLQQEYLQHRLNGIPAAPESVNPLQDCNCTFLFLFSGPICGNIYNEAVLGTTRPAADPAVLDELEKAQGLQVLPLRGHYHNETVYALVCRSGQEPDINAAAERIYHSAAASVPRYLHLIISETIRDGENIYDHSRGAYLFALFNNRFGSGSVMQCHALTNDPILVSPEIIRLCAGIPAQPSMDVIHDFLHSMRLHWEQEQVTQFQLVTDLRYFISTVIHDYKTEDIIYPDAEEIVSSCCSFDELEEALGCETDRIYGFDKSLPGLDQHSLARQVRSWLDKNFTTQITYKIFQDVFGYNEKYISSLFKAEYGLSPSKYIGELRLNMAKKLMQSNPDILLRDVAELTGFADAFYFSRVFKSHEGISPSAYAKLLKT